MIAAPHQLSIIRPLILGMIVVCGAALGYHSYQVISGVSGEWIIDVHGRSFVVSRGIAGQAVVQVASNADDMTLRRPPSITAQQIDAVLRSYHSPAVGSGKDFVTLGQQYGIDPVYALAFFIHESSAGTAGVAITTHGIGNIICAGYATCYDGFRAYSDWRSAIEDWYRLLDTEYIAKGLTNVDAVIPVYCPVNDGCDTQGYIGTVQAMVREWRNVRQVTVHKHSVTDSGAIGARFDTVNCDYWRDQPNCQHLGVDYLGANGMPIYAPYDMTFFMSGFYADPLHFGYYQMFHFTDGCEFYAGHLRDIPAFTPDQVVEAGKVIGYTNQLGHSHVQLKCNGQLMDYEQYEKEH